MDSLENTALIIWWCEGTKPRRDNRWKNSFLYPVEVINSNPTIIKIFIDYLVRYMNVPLSKLRGQIQIHEGDDQKMIENYWSEKTDMPISQFNKTIIRPKGNKIGKNSGTFKVRLYDKKVFDRLQSSLDRVLTTLNIV